MPAPRSRRRAGQSARARMLNWVTGSISFSLSTGRVTKHEASRMLTLSLRIPSALC
jgi:hypothetical protein